MFSYRRLVQNFRAASSRYKNKCKRLKAELEAAKDKYPRPMKLLIEPIAHAVADHLGKDFEIIEPEGLCSEVSVYFINASGMARCRGESLHFTSSNLEKAELRYNDICRTPIPLDADLQFFLDRLTKANRKRLTRHF